MKKNNRSFLTALLVSSFLLLQGCSLSEGELWGLGSFVFFVFVCIIIINGVVPRIQEVRKFQAFVTKMEIILAKFLPVFLILAIASIIYGAYSIVSNDDSTRQDLFVFVGAVILYMAVNLKALSRTENVIAKRNYLRAITLSVSFLVIFVYLLLGAPNIRL